MNQQRSPLEKRNALEEGQKQGCYVSTTLAIVVARRSWREISLWKTQHSKNSLNFVSTCLRVVDARRAALHHSARPRSTRSVVSFRVERFGQQKRV